MRYLFMVYFLTTFTHFGISQNENKTISYGLGKNLMRTNFEWWHSLHGSLNFNHQVQANLNVGIGVENTYRQGNFNPYGSFAIGYDFLKDKNTLAVQWMTSFNTYQLTPSTRLKYWTNGLGYYFSSGKKWKVFQSSYLGRGKEYVAENAFNYLAYQIEIGVKYEW